MTGLDLVCPTMTLNSRMSVAGYSTEIHHKAEDALRVAKDYLNARQHFLRESPQELLGGNDNFIGRIGELLAMLYLSQYHGLDLTRPRGGESNKSKKAVDLVTRWNTKDEVWWSVKAITAENSKGMTSIYKEGPEGFPPLIIVRFAASDEGINAECLVYPNGLHGEASLSTLTRFAEAQSKDGELELGEFNGSVDCPLDSKWKRVDSFGDWWDKLRKESTE